MVVGVRVPAIQRNLDAADSHFDQAAGRQTGPAKRRVSVGMLQSLRLAANLEGFELFGRHHGARAVHRGLVRRAVNTALASLGEGTLDDFQVTDPLLVPA